MTTENEWNEATTGYEAQTDEWRDVETETQIVLEELGEGWIARFMGMDPPNASGIVQAHWTQVTDLQGVSLENGEGCFINCTRDLLNKLKKVPVKAVVRCQWASNLNTGHASGTPMRVFKVQWRNA